ncbi:LysR family transcriptional regulator [Variovorax sp. OV329]|uniref:LysR family transcriptional regulator n=1 Tax=Variovorax sp. OV329 TaxID=1882825 RepID=UPI0008E078C8|nr:LysR family transcriptional regulator [Variovorax sp. OV329]SFM69266.1 transcriptional regulator, LysR family [Variovorax sp. OV329]
MNPSLLSIPMRYFLEVAQAGSVNQAAARLFVAASAVSRQIAKLEDGLGTPLFERQRQGMVLTAAGQRLAGHLRNTVLDAGQVIDEVRSLGGQSAGRVRICCTEGFASGFMQRLMGSFQAATPSAAIELHVGTPEEVSQRLLRGESDIGLKYVVAPEAGLHVEHAAPAPVLAVMRPAHPLARRRVVELAQAVRHPLLVGSPGMTARQLLDLACSAKGLQYRPLFVSNFSSVMLPLLRSRDIMLSSRLTVAHLLEAGELVARPFDEPLLQQRRLQALTLEGRTLPPLVGGFVRHMVASIAASAAAKAGARRQAGRAG